MALNRVLHAVLTVTAMDDSEKALMHTVLSQINLDGTLTQVSLNAGESLTWAPADANITVDATVDIKGAPSTDPMAAVAISVTGFAGDTSIVASLANNPDGTAVSTTFPFHMTLHVAPPLDRSITGSVDAPVAK